MFGARAVRAMFDRAARFACGGITFALAVTALAAGRADDARALNGITYDWCSAVVVRPDERFSDSSTCTPEWTAGAIAAGAEVALVGDFEDVSHPVIVAATRGCTPNPSHQTNATYVQSLRAARAKTPNGPLRIVHMARAELVPINFAALPGFSAGFLVETDRAWTSVTGFFTNDRSAACATPPCTWSDSYAGDVRYNPSPKRLRDFIDKSGGANRYQRIVYYLSRPTPPVYWPTSAIANLRNAGYRAWRVAEYKESIRVGGYDYVDLSNKLEQYRAGGWWIGTGSPVGITNVAILNATNETFWSAPPRGYTYSDYVQGWAQLARDLKAAGVPYSERLPLRAWTESYFDDPTTTSVNEAELVREVMRGAKLLLIDRAASISASLWATAEAQMRSYGATVIPIDESCGYGRPALGAPGQPSLQP